MCFCLLCFLKESNYTTSDHWGIRELYQNRGNNTHRLACDLDTEQLQKKPASSEQQGIRNVLDQNYQYTQQMGIFFLYH